MRLFRVGERVLLAHRYSWAKKAAAFPRNSVFIRNSRFSRSSSRSRARSGRVNGGSSPACSTRCLLTQLPSVPSCTPISRATSAIGREVSTTRRTASDLNSGVNFRRFSRIDAPPFRTGPYWVRYPKCGRHARVQHVESALIDAQLLAAGLAGLVDRAHQPLVLALVAQVGQCDVLVVGPGVERGQQPGVGAGAGDVVLTAGTHARDPQRP